MPPEEDGKIAELLEPMLKKRLFVALSKAVARPEQMLPFVAEHLEYMNQLENEGKLFASGPFIQDGALVGDGLTILQTSTLEEAHALMSAEPLIKRGLREFNLRPWELREGRMIITLNSSTSSFRLECPSGVPICPSASGERFARITATMATRGVTSATIKHVHALTIGVAVLQRGPVEWQGPHPQRTHVRPDEQ